MIQSARSDPDGRPAAGSSPAKLPAFAWRGSLAILGKSDPKSLPEGPPAGSGQASTVLGPRSRFVGDLSGDEDVVVNGRFEGTLRAERCVTVGPEADVLGQVHAREVVVSGRIHGDVHAGDRAELRSTCTIEGNVHAPKILIAEGARLEGKVAMSEKKERNTADSGGTPGAGGRPGPGETPVGK